jgi:hypothetical protein
VPWRDFRPLAIPADPWDTSGFERDSRRLTAANEWLHGDRSVDHAGDTPVQLDALTHEVWQDYAERGEDAVSQLLNDHRNGVVEDLLDWRSCFIELASGGGVGRGGAASARSLRTRPA